jgi:hypothetical protein
MSKKEVKPKPKYIPKALRTPIPKNKKLKKQKVSKKEKKMVPKGP